MKVLIRNNIFTNPEGWAKKAAGSPWGHRFIQAGIVLSSIALFIMFTLMSRPIPLAQHPGVGVSIAAFTLVFPLCYLMLLGGDEMPLFEKQARRERPTSQYSRPQRNGG